MRPGGGIDHPSRPSYSWGRRRGSTIHAGKAGDVIQVRVANLAMDPTTHNPVVLLEGVEAKGVLPIWIGQPEANAIAFQLAGQTFERPLTHDLLRIVIEGLEARVSKVLITELRGNTFFAKLFLARGNEILSIDARPSDSIALALRTRAPIYVSQELFESNRQDIETQSEPDSDVESELADDDPIKKFLDDLDTPDKPES
jgi:bifunctional DNase/RNase